MSRTPAETQTRKVPAERATWLEVGATWLYTRYRSRFVWILAAITAVVIECVVPSLVFLMGPVFAEGFSGVRRLMSVIVPASLLGIPSLYWVIRFHHGSALQYLRGEVPGPSPDEVWHTSVAELTQGVFMVACGYWVPLTGAAVFAVISLGGGLQAAIIAAYAVTVSVALVAVFLFLVWETALRPLARDVAPHLSADVLTHSRGPSISMKLFALLGVTSLFNGFAVGSMSLLPGPHSERVLVAALTSVAVSATLAGSVIWLLRRSFVTRVNEIQRALDIVESGAREGVTLAPLAGDELDDVAQSFNGMVRQLWQRESDMRDSRARIVAVADRERRRMERDLHDGAQQYLALIGLQASSIDELMDSDPHQAHSQLRELRVTLDAAQNELRNLAHGIYPATLETEGLAPALREAVGRATVPVTIKSEGVARLPRDVETAIYFCCLEALQNVSKYAGSDATASVHLAQTDHRISFTVDDNGAGFDVSTNGHGLTNMRDRIGAIGGHITIVSAPGNGTTVNGWVPLSSTA